MASLDGRVAIVTGGAQGIGAVYATSLAKEGAKVIISDVREESAEKVAAEIRAAGGQASAIAVDVSDISPKLVRHVPLDSWFRFRRAVEDTSTILLLLSRESNAKTCASLVLQLQGHAVHWLKPAPVSDSHSRANIRVADERHSSAWLLEGLEARAEILRSRMQPPVESFALQKIVPLSVNRNSGREAAAIFKTKTNWDSLGIAGAENKSR